MGRKGGHKRQASVDARRQILKVRGDYLELSDDDDEDDDEVIEITEAPTKKYKVSSRKFDGERNVLRLTRLDSEPTLEMDVWVDDLSPAQLAARKSAILSREAVQTVIDDVVKLNDGRLLLDTVALTALELPGYMKKELNRPATGGRTGRPPGRPPKNSQPPVAPPKAGYSIVLDPATSAILGGATSNAAPASTVRTPSPAVAPKKKFCKTYGDSTGNALMAPIIRTELPIMTQQPTVLDAIVDLTSDDNRSTPDSKEVSFNRLQGKTFPSLVVVARPNLRVPVEASLNESRNELDRFVKKILWYAPAQFTEYLIQQGLVKSEHYCQTHTNTKLKLGMYSDASRFPFSGGYIWISECCPPKFVSIFYESFFDGLHSPTVNFKLLYHWACQTNVQNILQWVKVENVYLKGLYTLLRGVCTVALHTHLEPLGGKNCVVEIGVISLGTTSQDGANRHVKVEVLGVLDTQTKKLMLRAADPNDIDFAGKNHKKRFVKILESLLEWVHPDSTLVVDLTIEKQSLHALGFNDVVRSGSNGHTNHTIMDYLRRIVPRMFQNTLSLLSRQIIQQFLDELVWREIYGTNSNEAFENILKHLAEQTCADTQQSLFTRLNKVAANPFKNWSLDPKKNTGTDKRIKRKSSLPLQVSEQQYIGQTPNKIQLPKQLASLEQYYYGTVECNTELPDVEFKVQCPLCEKIINNNSQLLLHLFRHIINSEYFCKYCLFDCGTKHSLYTHVEHKHAIETKVGRYFNCLICHQRFLSSGTLGEHMSLDHCPSELPYHCGSCGYKTSFHKNIIDHYYKQHSNQSMLQCPLCLFTVEVPGDEVESSSVTNSFIAHLQAHLKKPKGFKSNPVKCDKCSLSFLAREEVEKHGKRHICYKEVPNFEPHPEPENVHMVPKSLRDKDIKDTKEVDCPVTFSLPDFYKCKECNDVICEDSHFKTIMYCQKGDCKYQTLCRSAMTSHKSICSSLQSKLEPLPLEFRLFCVCGFSSKDGNVTAKHLSICERKSAYPSQEAAEKASVAQDMLDVLGLVRILDEDIAKPSKATILRKRKRRRILSDGSEEDNSDDDPDFDIVQSQGDKSRIVGKKQKADMEDESIVDTNSGKLPDESATIVDDSTLQSANVTCNDEDLKSITDITDPIEKELALSTVECSNTKSDTFLPDPSSTNSNNNLNLTDSNTTIEQTVLPLTQGVLSDPMEIE